MAIELLQQSNDGPLWAVRHNGEIIGALKYLGSAKWEYMDADGEQQFDAKDVDEAKAQITAHVTAKTAAEEAKPKGSIDQATLGAFFRHQFQGFEALAAITEGGVGPYTAELMIATASVLSDIDDETKRNEAREHLLTVLDEALKKHFDQKRRMAGIGQILSDIFQVIRHREEGVAPAEPPEKPPTH